MIDENTGGLAEDCTEEMLHAAFIPFGDIVEVTIPKDFKESESSGGRAGVETLLAVSASAYARCTFLSFPQR